MIRAGIKLNRSSIRAANQPIRSRSSRYPTIASMVFAARYVAAPHGLPPDKPEFALHRALRGETIHQERRKISVSGASTLEALISASPSPGFIGFKIINAFPTKFFAKNGAHSAAC